MANHGGSRLTNGPTRYNFIAGVLQGIGAPVSDQNVTALYCQMRAEGTRAKNNPFATTLKTPNSTDFNSATVQNYQTFEEGVSATVQTLKGNFSATVSALRHSANPSITIQHIGSPGDDGHPWGTPLGLMLAVYSSTGGNVMRGPLAMQSAQYLGQTVPGGENSVVNAIPGVGTVVKGAEAVANTTQSVASFLGKLTDPHTWYRVGQVILGGLLVMLGIVILFRQPIEQGAKIAGKVAPLAAL